jgi:ankyrin repeat protein
VVRFLLEEKVDPNQADDKGETALTWAARNYNMEAIRLLLEAGASPNRVTNYGETALTLAVNTSQPTMDMVRLLLEYGADPNHVDNKGDTAFTLVLFNVYKPNIEVVRLLLQARANPNHMNDQGELALTWAVRNSNWEVVRLLLDYDVNPDKVDGQGDTALSLAVRSSDIEGVRLLLEAGADPNQIDSKGQTALYLAVHKRFLDIDIDMIQILLDFGAIDSISIPDRSGKTLLDHIINMVNISRHDRNLYKRILNLFITYYNYDILPTAVETLRSQPLARSRYYDPNIVENTILEFMLYKPVLQEEEGTGHARNRSP